MCGHLFCWPCLVQWLDTRPNRQLCPVCKAAISKDKEGDNTDPREKMPPRPRGQRTEAPQVSVSAALLALLRQHLKERA
ncbi:hypothetical protein COOONC_14309 [Cooperia oncophora]